MGTGIPSNRNASIVSTAWERVWVGKEEQSGLPRLSRVCKGKVLSVL